ncbi:MAG: hypothetical protein LBU40_06315 [Methanobrevibacter sp.]|jgi:hypothetical protein|nr:hypothetical protein [Methanobrevibacter sp.]
MRNKLLIVGIVAIVIIVLGAFIVLGGGFNNSSDSSDEEQLNKDSQDPNINITKSEAINLVKDFLKEGGNLEEDDLNLESASLTTFVGKPTYEVIFSVSSHNGGYTATAGSNITLGSLKSLSTKGSASVNLYVDGESGEILGVNGNPADASKIKVIIK